VVTCRRNTHKDLSFINIDLQQKINEKSSFKVPDGFFNQFTKDSMKDYWAKGIPEGEVGQTFCSGFLPELTKKLGNVVYKDIFFIYFKLLSI